MPVKSGARKLGTHEWYGGHWEPPTESMYKTLLLRSPIELGFD